MSADNSWIGKAVADGAFVLESWIAGSQSTGRLLGRDQRSGEALHIGVMTWLPVSVAEARTRLSYEVEGVAPLSFIGCMDDESEPSGHVMVIETVGQGGSLTQQRANLSVSQRLRVARCVASAANRAAQQGVVLAGFQPDLVWIDEARPCIATLLSRCHVLLSVKQRTRSVGTPAPAYSDYGPFYDPMRIDPWRATAESDVYCFGLLLSWLFTGLHPFTKMSIRPNGSWFESMEENWRDPFTGPPAIGAILDVALIADPAQRAPIHEIVSMLDALSPDDVRESP